LFCKQERREEEGGIPKSSSSDPALTSIVFTCWDNLHPLLPFNPASATNRYLRLPYAFSNVLIEFRKRCSGSLLSSMRREEGGGESLAETARGNVSSAR